jgi:hypothetical protein
MQEDARQGVRTDQDDDGPEEVFRKFLQPE